MTRTTFDAKTKAKIETLYVAKGLSPKEIAAELGPLGVTAKTISNFITRRGLTARRTEAIEQQKKSAQEVVKQHQEQGLEILEQILAAERESLKTDTEKLKDGWPLVADAAGASALMRAKTLLADRTRQYFGIAQDVGNQGMPALSFYFAGNPEQKATSETGGDIVDVPLEQSAFAMYRGNVV